MGTLTFDTLQFVQRLKKAGVRDSEAEAIAEAVRDAQTNADIATKRDIIEVKAELKRDIAETKAELIKWVVSVGALQTALIGALLMRLIPG
jgi:phosphoribosylformylglycinamidine (FGAM) synthase PurS component